jgi:hypothetical protein
MTAIKRLLPHAALVLALAGGTACSWLFGGSWQPPQVVRIESEKELTALMPTWAIWNNVAEKGEPQGLLLRDGDYFAADDLFIRYLAADGLNLKVTFTDGAVRIGDQTVALFIGTDKKPDGSAWLAAATDRQLAGVRTLAIGHEIDEGAIAALKRLAAVNPRVDLSADSGPGFLQVLPLFRPRAVFAPDDLDAAGFKALAGQPQIETLSMAADEPGRLDVLSALPALRRLILDKWDVEKTGPLPPSLRSLKSLLVVNSAMADLKPIGTAAAGLEELSLINMNDQSRPTDLSGIDAMTRLRTLVLWINAPDLSKLAGLTDLRWVGLPPITTQEQFAAFVNAHPQLAILEITGNESLKDLSPLTSLKGLTGLVLDGKHDDVRVVEKLTTLRFVGLSKDIWSDSPEKVAAVRKALPDALVVRTKPVCLGSGWILLIVPVPFVAWWIRQRRSARASQAA